MDQKLSQNFHAAKFLSILTVIVGHFFDEFEMLWIPVTIALLIFSWSSGFFTYIKYSGNFNIKRFWQKKAERLLINLIVINIFLLILFLIQRRSDIWTWQSLVNIFGMNGFLNWFRIPNNSPFGAGMWFFTLLIIFYLFYPFLEFINREKVSSYLFVIIFVIIAFFLNIHVIYGHALWLTTCGFVSGVFCARNKIEIPQYISGLFLIVTFFLMLCFNYLFQIKSLNFFFILFLAIFSILFFKDLHIPDFLTATASFFSGSLLEIYLLHPYLTLNPTGYRFADFIISVLSILFTAKILQLISSSLQGKVSMPLS